MKNLCTVAFIVATLVIQAGAVAQIPQIDFERYSIIDGLSNDVVRSVTQDRYGYIWIGTEDGLNRFDGYSFKTYKHNPSDSSSIVSNAVLSLCCDSAGNLWIGTEEGLDRYDRTADRFIHHDRPSDIPPVGRTGIPSLSFDRHGSLWIATASQGLIRYDLSRRTSSRLRHDARDASSIPSDSITCLYTSGDGLLWIGYSSPLLSAYNSADGHLITFAHQPGNPAGLSASVISSICEDRKGNLWLSTWGDGIVQLDSSRTRWIHYRHDARDAHSLAENTISALAIDGAGRVWAATNLRGVDCYDPGLKIFRHFPHDPNNRFSMSSPRVYCVYPDRMGSVWIGTWRGGLCVYNPWQRKFSLFRHIPFNANSLNADTVWAICEDRKGRLWVGTEAGGLDCYDPSSHSFTHHVHSDRDPTSLSNDYVIQIREDGLGRLWIGTYGGGLDQFDEERNVFLHHRHTPKDPNSPSSDEITTLFVDSGNRLWLGYPNGVLDRFDPGSGQFVHLVMRDSTRAGTEHNETESIVEDPDGHLWIATFGSGLWRLDPRTNSFRSYYRTSTDPHDLPHGAIYTLAPDTRGGFWIGTFAGGLFRYDRPTGTFQQYTELQGLASNYIKGIVPDRRGRLWLSSIKGLTAFDPGRGLFRNYDISDGLQGIEFRRGSACRRADGTICFGGVNGLNLFDPDSVRDNPLPPPVVITAFKVFDQPLRAGRSAEDLREVELSYQQNFFAIEFVALNYSAPMKNRYAYCLEGFDKDWIPCGTRRFASYTHLDGGEYFFRVKASNNDGVWNETGAMLRIVIHPPYWETWWFRGILVLLIAGIPLSIYRYRSNKLLELERTRTRIARDLHDDIGATLTSVALFSELARKEVADRPAAASNRLERIAETSRSLLDKMNDIVWAINPENDTLENLLLRMKEVAVGLLDASDIRCELHFPDRVPPERLSMSARRDLFLIYKEIVHNVVKHSAASRAVITVAVRPERKPSLSIEVRDDGKGFDLEQVRRGNGLNNIEQRARMIRATVDYSTAEGKGTTVTLLLPLKSPL